MGSLKKYYKLFILIIPLLLTSCLKDVRTARKYVIDKPFKPIVLLPPASIIKSTFSVNPDLLDEKPGKLDIEKSLFLKDIDEDVFIQNFISTIEKRLTRYGYKVYGPNDISYLLEKDETAFVLSIAQLELMEYKDTLRPSYVFNYKLYEQAIPINTVVQNTWIEFSELNHPDRPMKVLFNMQHTADYIDGDYRYDYLNNAMVYEYVPFRIKPDDIYDLAEFAGAQNSQYLYDFLMNIYIADKIDKPFNVNNYLMIDRANRIIRRAIPEERFYIIKMQQ